MADTKGTDIARRMNEAPAERPKTLVDYVEGLRPEIARALPKGMEPDRIIRIAITALRMTPALAKCEVMSFIGALMHSAQLGLEPNTPLGEAWLIPYRKGDGYVCQFQIGLQGTLSLAHRTELYQFIYALPVYKNDRFSYHYGLNPDLVHVPADEPEGEPVYYYAVFKLKNGGGDFRVWPRAKVEAHGKRFSKAYGSGPWKTDFDSMACNTVLKNLLKYAPKTVEFARQLSVDESMKDAGDDFGDNVVSIIDMPDGYAYEVTEEDQEPNGGKEVGGQAECAPSPAPATTPQAGPSPGPAAPGPSDNDKPYF